MYVLQLGRVGEKVEEEKLQRVDLVAAVQV